MNDESQTNSTTPEPAPSAEAQPSRDGPQPTASLYKGHGGAIELHDDHLVIRREGAVAKAGGFGPTREIPLAAITTVTLKPASLAVNGYLQLQLHGDPARSHRRDPNAVLFTRKHASEFEELAKILQQRAERNTDASGDPDPHEANEADEQPKRKIDAEAQGAKVDTRDPKETRREERAAAKAEKLQAQEARRAAKRERAAHRGPVVAKYAYPVAHGWADRWIKVYQDGTIESGSDSGSIIGATARVDQTGGVASRGRHNRWVQDMRQTFLTIEGPGVAISVKISNDKRPVEKARKFAAQVNSVAQQLAPADGERPGLDAATIPDQIKKLAELRETGILSDEEFETKKRELLERM